MTDEAPGDDILEQGDVRERGSGRFRLPGRRPSRGAGILAAAALVVGLAAGYAAGTGHGHAGQALPRPAVTVTASPATQGSASSFSFADSPALYQDTGTCSVQDGAELQLGVQVTNQATEPVLLQTAKAVLPLGGLKPLRWQWGPCGLLPGAFDPADPAHPAYQILAASDSVWLTFTFAVQRQCPGPLPVQFSVGYDLQGQGGVAGLPGFPDLSQVPYAGCPSTAANTGTGSVQITDTP